METFSYRSLITLTMYLSATGGGLGLLLLLGRFLLPLFRGSSVQTLQTNSGMQVDLPASDSSGPRWLQRGSWVLLLMMTVSLLVNSLAMGARYVEVQHWPAQTMYEVIPLGVASGFFAGILLYFVLGLGQIQGIARAFTEVFMTLKLIAYAAIFLYVLNLDPTGRPLPPALQSYWFPVHITAYMIGYFTMFIGTLAVWLLFCFRFWRGLLQRGDYPVPTKELLAIFGFSLITVPFGQYGWLMGPGVLALTGVLAGLSLMLPNKLSWFDGWETGADTFTWKIFLVGFPFLTAGLIMGALWAQEAWAIYWGWDSKEVSALISWVFYAVYLHLRYVAGWKGRKGMWILLVGGFSVYITFQLFGYLPASQSSLHRYTDMENVPTEGLMGAGPGG
ncbi:MAG: hypothetical protein DWQ01_11895 [Planctomycetota bacterium]|nr:MAG: hypothetical protein DWQ01_11895 [Planctomycetota bacterium]